MKTSQYRYPVRLSEEQRRFLETMVHMNSTSAKHYVVARVLLMSALDAYVSRRRPRADWVQKESRAGAESFLLPPAVRNAAFRERGDQMMHGRFGPLIPAP